MTNPMLPATMIGPAQAGRRYLRAARRNTRGRSEHLAARVTECAMSIPSIALATHTVGAGEFWILEAAGGRRWSIATARPSSRRTATLGDQPVARYDRWLADDGARSCDASTMPALASVYFSPANPEQGMCEASSHPGRMHRRMPWNTPPFTSVICSSAPTLGRRTRLILDPTLTESSEFGYCTYALASSSSARRWSSRSRAMR